MTIEKYNLIYEKSLAYQASKSHKYASLQEYIEFIKKQSNFRNNWIEKYPDILFCIFFIYAVSNRIHLLCEEDVKNLRNIILHDNNFSEQDINEFFQKPDSSLPFINPTELFQDRFFKDLYEEIKQRGFSITSSYEFYFDLCSIETELIDHPKESFQELLAFLLSIYNKDSNEFADTQYNNEESEFLSILFHDLNLNIINRIIDNCSTSIIDKNGRAFDLKLQDEKAELLISQLLSISEDKDYFPNFSFDNHRCVLLDNRNSSDEEGKIDLFTMGHFIRTFELKPEYGVLIAPSNFIISPMMKDYMSAFASDGYLISILTVNRDSLIVLSRRNLYRYRIPICISNSWYLGIIQRTLLIKNDEIHSTTEAFVLVDFNMFSNCHCSIDPFLYILQKNLIQEHSNRTLTFRDLFSPIIVSYKMDDDTSKISSSLYLEPLKFRNDSLLDSDTGKRVFVSGPALLVNCYGEYLWLNEKKTYEIIIPINSSTQYFSGLLFQTTYLLPEYAVYFLTQPNLNYIWDILNNKSYLSYIESLDSLSVSVPSIDDQWNVVSKIGDDRIKRYLGTPVGISNNTRKLLSKFEKSTDSSDNDRYYQLLAMLGKKAASFNGNYFESSNGNKYNLNFINNIFGSNEISSLAYDFPNIIEYCCNAYNMDVSNKSLLQHSQPIELTKFCVSLLNPKPGSKIYVPFAGFGSYFKSLNNCVCIGEEISPEVCSVANIRLSYSGITSRITCGDSYKVIHESPEKYNYIITTPPLLKLESDKKYLDDGHFIRLFRGLYDKKLSNNGRMIIVAPFSFSYATHFNAIKKDLFKDGTIEMFISLPQVFMPLSSKYFAVIVIDKNRKCLDGNRCSNSSLLVDGSNFYDKSASASTSCRFLYEELLNEIKNSNSIYCVRQKLGEKGLNITPGRFLINNHLQDGIEYTALRDFINKSSYKMGEKIIATSEMPYIRISDLFTHYCSFIVSPSGKCKLNHPYIRITEPSALISFRNGYVRVGYVSETPILVDCNIGFFSINENNIKPEYLLKELLSDNARYQMEACMIFERRSNSDKMRDLMDIVIAIPSIHEQDIELKNDAFKELELANKKIKRQFDLYVEDTHMKKHAIGQNILNLRTYWDCLLQAREENKGNLPDDFALGIKHPLYVKEIIEKITMYLGEVSRGIENFTYAEDPRFKEKSDIDIDTFLRDYINTNTNPEYEIIYQPNLDNSLGQIHFSKVALKIILQNIISNAWQHGFKNRKEDNYIKVSWSETEDDLFIFISNNGCPIVDSMAQDELFKYGTSTRRGEADMEGHIHSGLGCYQIKALMNIDEQGDVTVISNPKSEYPVTYKLTFHKQ